MQQATLPSTGLITHNNYWNVALSNTYTFSPTWLGNLVLDASLLHLTQTRNSDLGFALQFPFSVTALTVSGFETFGDNQFATPITLFPDLRNQDKYQFRYDLSHVLRDHASQVRSRLHSRTGARAARSRPRRSSSPHIPRTPIATSIRPAPIAAASRLLCRFITLRPVRCAIRLRIRVPASAARTLPPAMAASRRTFSDWDSTPKIPGASRTSSRSTTACVIRRRLGLFDRLGPKPGRQSGLCDAAGVADSDRASVPQRLPQANRASPRHRVLAWRSEKTVIPRRLRHVLRRPRAERLGDCVSGRKQLELTTGPCSLAGGPALCAHRDGLPHGGAGATGNLIGSHYKTPYAIHTTGGVQHAFSEHWLVSADYTHEQGNHGYRAFPIPAAPICSLRSFPHDPDIGGSDHRSAECQRLRVRQPLQLQRADAASAGQHAPLQSGCELPLSKAQTWGCLLGELFDYVDGVCNPSGPESGPF